MAITTEHETLSTTAEQIIDASGISLMDRTTAVVRNLDASISVYLGGSSVSSSNGMLLKADETIIIPLGPSDDVYAVAASGTPDISILLTRGGALA